MLIENDTKVLENIQKLSRLNKKQLEQWVILLEVSNHHKVTKSYYIELRGRPHIT